MCVKSIQQVNFLLHVFTCYKTVHLPQSSDLHLCFIITNCSNIWQVNAQNMGGFFNYHTPFPEKKSNYDYALQNRKFHKHCSSGSFDKNNQFVSSSSRIILLARISNKTFHLIQQVLDKRKHLLGLFRTDCVHQYVALFNKPPKVNSRRKQFLELPQRYDLDL